MENDYDIDELKELVKKQALLNADTNKVVHSMRRMQRLKSLWSIVWWVLIAVASFYAYHYYLQPYLDQLIKLYGQAQGANSQFTDFLNNFKTH